MNQFDFKNEQKTLRSETIRRKLRKTALDWSFRKGTNREVILALSKNKHTNGNYQSRHRGAHCKYC